MQIVDNAIRQAILHQLEMASSHVLHTIEIFTEELKSVRRGSLANACTTFKKISDAYETLDARRKALNSLLEQLSRNVIPEMMMEQKTTTITLEFGDLKYRFVKGQRVSCSLVDKDIGIQWLKDQKQEALVQETVNSSTLAAWAKDWVQEKGMDLPGEIFKLNTMSYTSVTKA